jgi:hypothetical protein
MIEICGLHLHAEPESPSKRRGGTLPRSLEALVLQCLKKNPDERPPSATALAKALAACQGVSVWTDGDGVDWWQDRSAAVLDLATPLRRVSLGTSAEYAVAVKPQGRTRPV